MCCRVPHLLLQVTPMHGGLQLGGHHVPRFGVRVKGLNLPALGYGLKQGGMCFGEPLAPHSAPRGNVPCSDPTEPERLLPVPKGCPEWGRRLHIIAPHCGVSAIRSDSFAPSPLE